MTTIQEEKVIPKPSANKFSVGFAPDKSPGQGTAAAWWWMLPLAGVAGAMVCAYVAPGYMITAALTGVLGCATLSYLGTTRVSDNEVERTRIEVHGRVQETTINARKEVFNRVMDVRVENIRAGSGGQGLEYRQMGMIEDVTEI